MMRTAPIPRFSTAALAAIAVGAGAVLRRGWLRWGATDAEMTMDLPGDEILAEANLSSTRGIAINATAAEIWPWVAQLGQGRGGFYSYDWLENLAGCRMRSADQVVADWQQVALGDPVHLHPEIALEVAAIEPGRVLVLSGTVPMGAMPPPYEFSWAFVLCPNADGTTRLLVRERYRYTRRWAALLVEPVELVSFVMSQKMLRGIRARAEQVSATSAQRSGG